MSNNIRPVVLDGRRIDAALQVSWESTDQAHCAFIRAIKAEALREAAEAFDPYGPDCDRRPVQNYLRDRAERLEDGRDPYPYGLG